MKIEIIARNSREPRGDLLRVPGAGLHEAL